MDSLGEISKNVVLSWAIFMKLREGGVCLPLYGNSTRTIIHIIARTLYTMDKSDKNQRNPITPKYL